MGATRRGSSTGRDRAARRPGTKDGDSSRLAASRAWRRGRRSARRWPRTPRRPRASRRRSSGAATAARPTNPAILDAVLDTTAGRSGEAGGQKRRRLRPRTTSRQARLRWRRRASGRRAALSGTAAEHRPRTAQRSRPDPVQQAGRTQALRALQNWWLSIAFLPPVRRTESRATGPVRYGMPGGPSGPHHATVHKTRQQGRVTAVQARRIFGELGEGPRVSTSYLERHNVTDRHRNARKARKSYCFS